MTTIAGGAVALTGAGDGIGRALAMALAAKGADLALSDINAEKLAAVGEEIRRRHNVSVTTFVLDVANREQVAAFAADAIRRHPKLHIVINNAGVALTGRLDEIERADFDWLMAINFEGVVNGTYAFLSHLKSRPEAHLVNTSSVFGMIAPPGQTAYAAAKFAVRGFTEALRHELAGTSVHVSAVHPGGIATNIAANARVAKAVDPTRRAEGLARFAAAAKSTPEQAAARIIDGIERNEPRILIGRDARIIDKIQRFFPVTYMKVLQRLTGMGAPPPPPSSGPAAPTAKGAT